MRRKGLWKVGCWLGAVIFIVCWCLSVVGTFWGRLTFPPSSLCGVFSGAVPVPLTLSSSSRSGSVSAEEQWNNWGSMERQGVMMKVIRSLQLNDPSGIFSRQLDAETLQVRSVWWCGWHTEASHVRLRTITFVFVLRELLACWLRVTFSFLTSVYTIPGFDEGMQRAQYAATTTLCSSFVLPIYGYRSLQG